MTDVKRCSRCRSYKTISEYYMCSGKCRSECKVCTIKRNVRHQKDTCAWKTRYVDDETRKLYMRDYYAKNKKKFAEYRAKFKKKYPDYYKDYSRERKENKNARL